MKKHHAKSKYYNKRAISKYFKIFYHLDRINKNANLLKNI